MGKEDVALLPLQLSNEEVSMETMLLLPSLHPERWGKQRAKSAVLNSAVSGGLNVGVAGEKPLITLNQILFNTEK